MLRIKHEERHAIAMWLVAAVLGGFAILLWWVGRLERDALEPVPDPPVEMGDSIA